STLESHCKILDRFSPVLWPDLYGEASVQFPCDKGNIFYAQGLQSGLSFPVAPVEDHQVLPVQCVRVDVQPVSLKNTSRLKTIQSLAHGRSGQRNPLTK